MIPAWRRPQNFSASYQNKLLFAATGYTAAELIHGPAGHQKPNLGLSTWPGGEVRATDVTMVKNNAWALQARCSFIRYIVIYEYNDLGRPAHAPRF